MVGAAPGTGDFGPGVFGSIIYGRPVTCGSDAEPAGSLIDMDTHPPDPAPPGFTFKAMARQP